MHDVGPCAQSFINGTRIAQSSSSQNASAHQLPFLAQNSRTRAGLEPASKRFSYFLFKLTCLTNRIRCISLIPELSRLEKFHILFTTWSRSTSRPFFSCPTLPSSEVLWPFSYSWKYFVEKSQSRLMMIPLHILRTMFHPWAGAQWSDGHAWNHNWFEPLLIE